MISGSNFAACIGRIAARGRITPDEARDLLEQVSEAAERMRRTGVDEPVVTAAWDLARKIKDRAAADRIDALNNAVKRQAGLARAESEMPAGDIAPKQTFAGRYVPGMKVLGLADGIRSMMHWVPGASRHDNAETMWQTVSRNLIATMGNRLRQLGLEKAALAMRGTDMEREVAEAMWRNNGGVPDSRVTISGNSQHIADSFWAPLENIRARQNAEGARIGTGIDYVGHTNWDPRQLRLAAGKGATSEEAFQAWLKRERPRIADVTFRDVRPATEFESEEEARTRFLRSVFFATATGTHMRQPGMAGMAADDSGYVPMAFEGTHNIGRSVSQPRVIHWNNAGDWLDHMREFGGGDGLYAQVARTLDVGSRRTAIMHYFGTNPEGNLNLMIRAAQEKYRSDLDGRVRFDAQTDSLRNTMGRLTGVLNVPAHAERAEAFEALMSIQAASHLGGVALTHFSAAPMTFSSELAHHGVSRFDAITQALRAPLSGRGGEVAQEAMADAGAYAAGYGTAINRSMGAFDHGIPGFVSWATSHFMRLTGIEHVLNSIQAKGIKSVLMDRLGRAAGEALDRMEIHQQAVLKSYGIGSEEWDLLRNAADPVAVEGKRWITPGDALNADPDMVETLLRSRGMLGARASAATIARETQRFQWDLADKIGMYLNDAADHGAVRPGIRERAMVLGNLHPGDKGYMLWRALAQFKMWPLAAANQILGREIAMSLSNKEMASNIGIMLALATAGGAVRMAVNDAAVGNAPRDYKNPVTLLAALAQGGGLGIYGDFLFGEVSRLGAGGIATMTGPIGSDVDRLMRMASDFRLEMREHPDKAIGHLFPQIVSFTKGHVPFGNLIYLKGALDYLLWYHLYEASSPGWWERTNRQMQKERGRTMTGYDPGAGVPWGLPNVYLQPAHGRSSGLLAGSQQ